MVPENFTFSCRFSFCPRRWSSCITLCNLTKLLLFFLNWRMSFPVAALATEGDKSFSSLSFFLLKKEKKTPLPSSVEFAEGQILVPINFDNVSIIYYFLQAL